MSQLATLREYARRIFEPVMPEARKSEHRENEHPENERPDQNERLDQDELKIWTTNDGRRILMAELGDDHLINCIFWMHRRVVKIARLYLEEERAITCAEMGLAENRRFQNLCAEARRRGIFCRFVEGKAESTQRGFREAAEVIEAFLDRTRAA